MYPLVTIIVPNYNHSRYLPRRLESIRNQTFTDYELIFLDDASTDDSLAVAGPILEKMHAKIVLNPKNSGSPFIQWNRGVSMAKGQYVWLAESDDAADPDFLEVLTRELVQDPTISVSCCQSRIINEHDEPGRLLMPPGRWSEDYRNHGMEEIREQMIFGSRIPNASAVVFRRDIYLQVGGADERMRLCGDWLLWLHMLTRGGIAYSAKPMNLFREHSSSVRSKTMKSETFVRERYQILAHAISLFPGESDLITKAKKQAACDWASVMVSPRGILSYAANRRIAAVATSVDRFAFSKALRSVPARLLSALVHRMRSRRTAAQASPQFVPQSLTL